MRSPRRTGFTLIELLVAVTIFLILATVTLTAVGAFQSADQVSGSARQVQSFTSGARDRAIYTVRTDAGARSRGVRLLVNNDLTDANGNPFACTTLQYVESAGYFPPLAVDRLEFADSELLFLAGGPTDGTVAELVPPVFVGGVVQPYKDGDDGNPPDFFLTAGSEREPIADKPGALATAWRDTPLNRVFQAGLLGENIPKQTASPHQTTALFTARVRLPKYANGAGRWYQALIVSVGSEGESEQALRLKGIARVFLMTLSAAEDPQEYNLNAAEDGYVFELRTVPLAGEDPRPLPNQTAIDLRGAARFGGLPSTWFTLVNHDGDGSTAAIPVPRGPLDIMFDPSGMVTGPLAASGLIHLPVVSLEDLDEGTNSGRFAQGEFLPLGYVGTDADAPIAFDGTTYSGPGKSAEDLVVTINTQTGTVTVAPLDGATSSGNGIANDPFRFAELGLEAP
ncbi:pilus assembly FimT family protein [Alienimonas californiensis]|uniref:Prepilin-type N-terminal cleavage/methylation domain-containing protein n=1 Tax=Alienimonas californiensis TaxID=2527989 RepID=A0A517P7J6_9PLAN|nr:prepilin-type N-terminal cleavage/methylation domain-containing protein [Alienimonas californiensis]QDT15354.1 hypothetical protein CA12_14390 [Alienimonas californiensis]